MDKGNKEVANKLPTEKQKKAISNMSRALGVPVENPNTKKQASIIISNLQSRISNNLSKYGSFRKPKRRVRDYINYEYCDEADDFMYWD